MISRVDPKLFEASYLLQWQTPVLSLSK